MATRKRTTVTRIKDNPFYARMKALGCTYCGICHAYMWPEHARHINLAGDWHRSRYVVVGGYGNTRLVELDADDMPEAA